MQVEDGFILSGCQAGRKESRESFFIICINFLFRAFINIYLSLLHLISHSATSKLRLFSRKVENKNFNIR